MGKEPIPKVDREVGVHAAEAGNKMILESSNTSLSSVAAVDLGWH